jgi:formylmethanofuran dehydrogenase subunit B
MGDIVGKMNGWLKILTVFIPFAIAGIIWGSSTSTRVDSVCVEVTEIKKDNTKRTETIVNIQIEQAHVKAKLDNIEKLLIEIKSDIRNKK